MQADQRKSGRSQKYLVLLYVRHCNVFCLLFNLWEIATIKHHSDWFNLFKNLLFVFFFFSSKAVRANIDGQSQGRGAALVAALVAEQRVY